LNLPFHYQGKNFVLEIVDLPPDPLSVASGQPTATLALKRKLQGDDTFLRHLLGLISITGITMRFDASRQHYTFLVNSYIRTSADYSPTHFASDIEKRVNWLEERIVWRKEGRDRFLFQGLHVTFKGHANVEEADKDLRAALKQAGVRTTPSRPSCLSEEDHTFLIFSHTRPMIAEYFS
jgi:hypothetical protein